MVSMLDKRKRVHFVDFSDISEDSNKLSSLVKNFSTPKNKTLVQGTVVDEVDDKIWIEIAGVKSEGVIYTEEFNVKGLGQKPSIGDKIEIWLQNSGKSDSCENTVISFVKGAQIRAWKSLEMAYKNKKPIDGIILGSSVGSSGFVVSIMPYAARAFLPISQLDQNMRSPEAMQSLKTDLHPYLIIRMDKRNSNIMLTRKL